MIVSWYSWRPGGSGLFRDQCPELVSVEASAQDCREGSGEVHGDVRSHRARPVHLPFAAIPSARCTINCAARSHSPIERAHNPPSVAYSLAYSQSFSPQQLWLNLIRWLIRLLAYSISVSGRPAHPAARPACVGERSRVRAIQPSFPCSSPLPSGVAACQSTRLRRIILEQMYAPALRAGSTAWGSSSFLTTPLRLPVSA